jgi:hypothetical protein
LERAWNFGIKLPRDIVQEIVSAKSSRMGRAEGQREIPYFPQSWVIAGGSTGKKTQVLPVSTSAE